MANDEKQYVRLRALEGVTMCVLAITLVVGAFSWWGGFADYPCSVQRDGMEDCLRVRRKEVTAEQARAFRIEAFLSVRRSGVSGGGCSYQHSETNALELMNTVTGVKVERVKDGLNLNGKSFPKDREFQDQTLLTLNPWTVARIDLRNLGLARICEDKPGTERVVVEGNYGSEFAFLKGLPLVLALVWVLFSLDGKLKRLKAGLRR